MLSGLDNPLHILILCAVILLVFGAKRLPEMGRSLGSGMREFKSGITGQHETTPRENAVSPRVVPAADSPGEDIHPS
jgi:sec-independent protein translocase protein TatA